MITTEVIVDALKDRFLDVTTLTREAESKEYIGVTADYVSVFPLRAIPRPQRRIMRPVGGEMSEEEVAACLAEYLKQEEQHPTKTEVLAGQHRRLSPPQRWEELKGWIKKTVDLTRT